MNNAVDENQDLLALQALLTSWHVGILFEVLKDEGITTRELKMMDYSHMHSLLKDYKLGVKIRFEYNLKSWRHKLGIPFKSIETNHHSCCCCNKRYHEINIIENPPTNNTPETNASLENDSKRRRLNIDIDARKHEDRDVNQASLSPQSVNSNGSLINMLHSDEVFNFGNTTTSTNEKVHNNDSEIDMMNMPLKTLGDFLSDFDNNSPPKFPSKIIHEKYSINLRNILRMSGSRGVPIIKFFKAKGRLTNLHRTQLIQIIVDYFIDNDCHLSLNLSHNLEWEILKMFPTEKLEYYRTEKRGKIYAKFSNMKRYKRDRNLKANTEAEMQTTNSYSLRHKTDEHETTNLAEANDDSWYPTAEPEIVVKEENENANRIET